MKIRHKLHTFSAQIALPQTSFLFSSRGKFYSLPRKMKLPAKTKPGNERKFVSRHTLYIYLGLFNLAAVNNAQDVVNLLQLGETLLEALEVLLLGLTPLHLT